MTRRRSSGPPRTASTRTPGGAAAARTAGTVVRPHPAATSRSLVSQSREEWATACGPPPREITPDLPQEKQADEFIDVANGGTHAMLRSFGPMVRPGGRLIVVASALGTLGNLDERLHPQLENASLDEVESLVESWRTAIHAVPHRTSAGRNGPASQTSRSTRLGPSGAALITRDRSPAWASAAAAPLGRRV
jgi:hypothetical protein